MKRKMSWGGKRQLMSDKLKHNYNMSKDEIEEEEIGSDRTGVKRNS